MLQSHLPGLDWQQCFRPASWAASSLWSRQSPPPSPSYWPPLPLPPTRQSWKRRLMFIPLNKRQMLSISQFPSIPFWFWIVKRIKFSPFSNSYFWPLWTKSLEIFWGFLAFKKSPFSCSYFWPLWPTSLELCCLFFWPFSGIFAFKESFSSSYLWPHWPTSLELGLLLPDFQCFHSFCSSLLPASFKPNIHQPDARNVFKVLQFNISYKPDIHQMLELY